MKILIINGPNLNLLGKRRPEIYGNKTFESFLDEMKPLFAEHEIDYYQSNCEGDIVTVIQNAGYVQNYDGIVLNPGAYAHYSLAIADAVECCGVPVIEVHISNIHAREEFRHKSVVSRFCRGVICGLGLQGYELAIRNLVGR